ncbi:MAG: hypothetical protein QOH70_3115 [Blastocatellia bacterium]|jgi:hypothetical protein|nr:hypothetical protein [Blastocatellia bacterium]
MKRRDFLASSAIIAGMPLIVQGMPSDFLERTFEDVLQQPQSDAVIDQLSYSYWLNSSTAPAKKTSSGFAKKTSGFGKRQTDSAKKSSDFRFKTSGVGETMSDSAKSTAVGSAVTAVAEDTSDASLEADGEGTPSFIIGEREPKLVVYTDQGFRFATDPAESELVEKGDVDVTVLVNALRPSARDSNLVQNAIGGSFRLDFGQQNEAPFPDLGSALAWSSIGVLASTSVGKKLPKLDALKFETAKGTLFGTPQKIPLVGGSGQWRWSFYVQKQESGLLKALKFLGSLSRVVGSATPAVFTGLGLPAIAWTALQSVDGLYAYLHAKETQSDWLFQGLQTPVAATASAMGLGVVGLRKGLNQYLVVPSGQTGNLAGRADLEVSRNGFLVPKGTDPLRAVNVAKTTEPGITYISLSVEVKSRPAKVEKPAA